MAAVLTTSFLANSESDHIPKADSFLADGLVHLHRGQPFTTTLVIAQVFQRKHGNVLRTVDSLIADGTIDRLNFEPSSYLDAHGREQRMILLTETGALIALPFLGGKGARAGQARLVYAFMALRKEERRQQSMGWHDARGNASVGFRMMSDALVEVRAAQEKATHPYHYANEAKMINKVVFGVHQKQDRNCLSSAELTLIEKLEIRNAVLIAQGKSYSERKAALLEFVKPLRQLHEVRPTSFIVQKAKCINHYPHRPLEGAA
jgi:Rha family phage regulatory protein